MSARFGTVLAAALGLAAVGGATALLIGSRPRAIDGQELLAATFDEGALPFDLRVASASRLPTGERTVVLEPPGLEPEAPPPPFEPKPPVEGAPPGKPFDWSQVPLGEPGKPPRQALIVWFPESTAEAQLRSLFHEIPWRDLRDIGDGGGLLPLDSGKLDWGGYDAPYVHLRAFEPGATFRDSIRVNVSAAGSRCALHVLWPRGAQGSKEVVSKLLAALAPRVKPTPRGG